jgi:hypothetical protein
LLTTFPSAKGRISIVFAMDEGCSLHRHHK